MIVEVQGFKFSVTDPKDYIQRHWAIHEFYEARLLDYIKKNCKGGNFIDAGSNIGNHAVFLSKIADTLYSFEPVLQSYNLQMENIKLNKIKNIVAFQCALGNETNKTVGLTYNIGNMGNTKVIKRGYKGKADEFVLMHKLDDFGLKNIKVMKIDVEGFELEVLKGAKQTLLNNDVVVFVECLTPPNLKEISTYLDKLGYNTWQCLAWNFTDVRDGKTYQDRIYKFTEGEEKC